MVSLKKFLNVSSDIKNYLIDFYIADDRFVRCFNYYYDPNGTDGDTLKGIFVRTVDAPEDEDMIDPSKYAIVNNSVMLYEGLPEGSTLVVEVATDLEEIGEAIRNIYSQEAKEYYNMIKNIFYGKSDTEPTTRPDGSAIVVGDLYLDTSVSPERMKVYSSTLGWTDATYNDTDIDKVTTVADDLTSDPSNVKTVADSIDNVNTTAGSIANVNTVADDLNLSDSNIKTVATNIDNVNITGSNITDVNTFAKVYQNSHDSDPSTRTDGSDLQVGDLYFNTTISKMKVYDGSTWQLASSAINGMLKKVSFTGDGTTTSFAVTDGYDANFGEVFLNGVNVTDSVDLSDGQNIVFNTAPADGDEILGVFFGSFVLADCYTKAEADQTFVNVNDYEDTDVVTKVENVVGELVKTTGTEVVKKDNSWIKNQVTAWFTFYDDANGVYILDSYNIDSIVRNDTGLYKVTFTNTMTTKHYSIIITGEGGSATGRVAFIGNDGDGSASGTNYLTPRTDSFTFSYRNLNDNSLNNTQGNNINDDVGYISIIVIGGK